MNTVGKLVLLIILMTLVFRFDITVTSAWKPLKSKYTRLGLGRKSNSKLKPNSDSQENPFQPRLVGGRPVSWAEAPYYLRMRAYDEFRCGASLLNHRGLSFAVTAAHCVWDGETNNTHIEGSYVKPEYIQLVGADLDKEQYQPREQWFSVVEMRIHENYDPRWELNDIALMYLDRYVFESQGLEHVPIPKETGWDDPAFGTIVGHGAKFRFDDQRFLQRVEMKVVQRDICAETINHWNPHPNQQLKPNEFCVGHPPDWIAVATCFGDSGGPVVAYNYSIQEWYLAGIVSWSQMERCGADGAVTVVTKVSEHVPWILKNAQRYLELHGTGNPFTNGTPEDRR